MTEAVVAQRNTVAALGFANPLNLPANAEADSHIKVYADDELLTQGPDYELDGVGDTGNLDAIDGVDVILDADIIAGEWETFTVVHEPPLDQDGDLSSGGTLGAIYELALDAIMRRVQSQGSKLERVLILPPSALTSEIDVTLPHPEDRRALVWVEDEDGFHLELTASDPDTEPLTSAVEAQEAAEDAAAAAAVSAAAADADATAAAASAAAAAQSALDAAAAAGDVEAVLEALEAAKLPIGSSVMFNGTSAPTGTLKENGAAVNRTTYDELFAVIGTTFGAGDGSTTFNVPESRGEFFRGLDDGRGIDTGRTIASAQSEMIGPHTHTASETSSGAHTHTVTNAGSRHGLNGNIPSSWYGSDGDNANENTTKSRTSSSDGAHTHTITVNANSGTENRPRNKAKLMCIKF